MATSHKGQIFGKKVGIGLSHLANWCRVPKNRQIIENKNNDVALSLGASKVKHTEKCSNIQQP
jgi:hypothetical protein